LEERTEKKMGLSYGEKLRAKTLSGGTSEVVVDKWEMLLKEKSLVRRANDREIDEYMEKVKKKNEESEK
jgi:hypothetical protein